ncbi:hypothetical protein B0T36_03040 [Nocardia donostiensis]|uniref:hypothetical protein n=1 Tax=Nocardia donostiensis TaxID=1538463 RepID=UPI0009F150AA|nr:hypothetical protein [Nocardia donostiensis]OQS16662.1 hypothetical protein B0T36_03040 [Nocardia donostiensis]
MNQVIKVFTPIKRVPTMIGKAQNGQKLPFGPYTLPQVAGVAVSLLITAVGVMTLPLNPAVTFVIGVVITVVVGFLLGLIPYTGVRIISRTLWFGRLIFFPKPVSASGMPVTEESSRVTMFIEETVVLIFPDRGTVKRPEPVTAMPGGQFLELLGRHREEANDTETAQQNGWRSTLNGYRNRRPTGEAS